MKQKDNFLQEALKIASIGCWEWDLSDKQLSCTDEIYTIFGLTATTYSPDYQLFLSYIHEEDVFSIKKAYEQALHSHKLIRVEFCITRPDGQQRIVEASGQVKEDQYNGEARFIGALQDITARKSTQKEGNRSERLYRFIVDSVPAMLWIGHGEATKDFVNTWMINYTGMSAQQLLQEGWLTAVHPNDREAVVAAQANALSIQAPYQVEIRFRRADGSYRWHSMQALPYKDEQGNMTRYIGINTDIHEQKLKEEALRENSSLREITQKLKAEMEFSESILENSLTGIFAFDSQGYIIRWNRQMEFLSGKKREQVLGKPLVELFGENGGGEAKAIELILKGEKVTLRKHTNPFGPDERFYEINFLPLAIEGEPVGGIGTIYDVTEIIKLEEEQTNLKLEGQKERANAILRTQERERERIAESLHNGIGQLLFAVKLNLQSIQTHLLEPETQTILTKVTELLNEAIRQSRTVSFELVPAILKDFGLEATLIDLAQALSSPAISIQVEIEGLEKRLNKFLELSTFRIIGALLSNVMEHSEATEALVKIKANENTLLVSVIDNGKGFDPDTATASVQEGNLQTIKNRVALLNGKLTIDSVKEKGTRVTVLLPLGK